MDCIRVKVFPSLTDADGHLLKYLQPRGQAPRVYFVARCLREVLEGDAPLWVVEGEKKACAVAQLGLPAIAIAGVEGWHRRGELRLLPDFDAIRLRGRIVEVLPDGDVETNPNVRRAVHRLGTALAERGARPRLVHLPRELPR
jgi:ribulose 1,5-bisphosphate synthetase/thiazole synthase